MTTKQKITVQCLSLIDGSIREVVANVTAETEQEAVNKLYALGKDEIAYRYLRMDGVVSPENPLIPALTTKYAAGEWYARA